MSVRAEPTTSSDTPADNRVVVPSILQHGANGSYVCRGSGFDAQIAPNGSVTMRDRYGRFQLFGGTFDLTAIASH